MAEAASDLVTFDIIDGILRDSEENILKNLTEEERLEVDNVVTLLDIAKEDSLKQFDLGDNTTCHTENVRHKVLSDEELDRLAGKTVHKQQPTRLNGLLWS